MIKLNKYKVASFIAWILLVGVVLLAFTAREANPCKGIVITIQELEEGHFVDYAEVQDWVQNWCSETGEQQSSTEQLNLLEIRLQQHPAISSVQAWQGVNGQLYVEIKQRKPLARIINMRGEHAYLDETGTTFPADFGVPARVMLVTGNLNFSSYGDNTDSNQVLNDIFKWIQPIAGSDFWLPFTEQLHRNSKGEFLLVPKLGKHLVFLGSPDNQSGKLFKLEHFYSNVLGPDGWNEYRFIDARFKHQVVCSKIEQFPIK
jgi:cell division protein FtsQ